jgi:ribosomal-protein-alanine N-acetyltransferase
MIPWPAPPLRLVPVRERHLPELQRFASDPKVAATCNLPHPYPDNGALQFFKHINSPRLKGVRYTFAIVEGGQFRGICGIGREYGEESAGEVGYWVALPFWGRGLATAATALLVDFGFRKMRLERQFARCLTANPASRKVLENNGFRYTRTAPEQFAKWPDPQPTDFLELTRDQWLEWKKQVKSR